MHEISLAQSLANSAIKIAKENGAKKIKHIVVKIGTFAAISEESFRMGMNMILDDDPIADNVNLEIIYEDGILECKNCGYHGTIPHNEIPHDHSHEIHPTIKCPECHSLNTKIISGLDSYLDKIDIQK